MNSSKYKKMDKFVNEMNQSVNVVGDMSIYLFSRFRNFVGYLFITVTTVAIAFIVAEFVRGFGFAPVMGVDFYYMALFFALVLGLFVAFFGEEAKIATIKGAIFSSGSNRTWQALGALFIILVLIIVNAKGVQKIADFSFRYMDAQLQESVIYKLKEKKMENHSYLASANINTQIENSALDALFQSRKNYNRAKQKEIRLIEDALASYILGRDAKMYRTYIANKKLQSAKKISKIEDKWNRKISNIDKKILNLQDRLSRKIDVANKIKKEQIQKVDRAAEDLILHYKQESNNNKELIDRYKYIGLIVAIGGEIVDGFLAFLLFMIVKSNPNVNGTPKVQANTRKMVKMKSYDNQESGSNNIIKDNISKDFSKKEYHHQKKDDNELSDKLFIKIKKVAASLSKKSDNFIKVGMNKYLKHPSQRELISAFADYNIIITPYQIGEYFTKMEDEIMFVNQKIGFVYTKALHNIAA